MYMHGSTLGMAQRVRHVPCPLSDHSAVVAELAVASVSTARDGWIHNDSHLDSPAYCEMVKGGVTAWKHDYPVDSYPGGRALWLDDMLAHLASLSREWGKGQARTHSRLKEALTADLDLFSSALDAYPDDPHLMHSVQMSKSALAELESKECQGARVRSRAVFYTAHEKPTKRFFSLERSRGSNALVVEVKHPLTQQTVTSEEDKMDAFRHFYQDLFTDEGTDTELAREKLGSMKTLDPLQALPGEGRIGLDEAKLALDEFGAGRAPGPDGFSASFWKQFWPELGEDLVGALNWCFDHGQLTPLLSSGTISVLHKKGDKDLLKNYRPITLLCTHYKIMTRVLSDRLAKMVHTLVHASQTGFIKGRYIGENIRLVLDLIEWCKHQDIAGYAIFLDMMKACDRCSWVHVHQVTKAVGLGSDHRRWIYTIYHVDRESLPACLREDSCFDPHPTAEL
jgi:hypothetical protein